MKKLNQETIAIFLPFKKINQNNLRQFDQHYLKMEIIFMNTKNSKTNEPHKFRLTLADKLNLKDPSKNMALANLSIYCTRKNIKDTTTLSFCTNLE